MYILNWEDGIGRIFWRLKRYRWRWIQRLVFWMDDWKGISFGVGLGIGESASLSLTLGKSTSVLLNDMIPTNNRGMLDRITNAAAPIPSGVVAYFKRKW